MNNETNNLNSSQNNIINENPVVTVVGENDVTNNNVNMVNNIGSNVIDTTNINNSNIEATISVDNSGNVDPISLEYNEYRNDLNKIYSTTTDQNSLISKFVIENGKCNHTLVVKYANGTVSTEKSHIFDYTDNFKNNFLIAMLEDYNKCNTIFDDSVVVKENSLATFTARTKDNDSLIIENIDMDLASKLSDLVYIKDSNNPNLTDSNTLKQVYNEHGIGNIAVIVLTIALIGMTVVGTIFFTIMANK